MSATQLRLVGVELYFADLVRAKDFYTKVLRLPVGEEHHGHFAKLDFSSAFVCLERKGSESYPSQDIFCESSPPGRYFMIRKAITS